LYPTEQRGFMGAISAPLQRLPGWLRSYVSALVSLILVIGLSLLILQTVGPRANAFCSMLLLIMMGRAAWLGYGPGALVATLTLYVVQDILVPNKPHPVPLIQFGFLLLILCLISRIAQNKRRTEARLRSAAESLEGSVTQRTLELSRKEERLLEQGQLLDLAPVAILAADQKHVIRVWSRGAESMYGWSAEEALGHISYELLKTAFPMPLEELDARLLATGSWEGEVTHTRRDGKTLRVMSRWAPHRDTSGHVIGSLQVNTDVTERHRIEEQLRHSQKLETAGLLAGGVAHDFNNLLTVINGYAEMLLGDVPDEQPQLREGLKEIRAAGERAAELTKQLLAFGRKQLLQPKVLDVNTVIGDVQKMLGRLIGEDIRIVTKLDTSVANIVADAGQLQQIIMNLAVNARDAMPQGGTLLFETANVMFDESFQANHPEVRIGPAVLLGVTDTGTGMTPEVRARLFEPFFTTKPKGSGTGLGLSTVYGIVTQAGGWIWVYSELGQGTAFKIYFPATEAKLSEASAATRPALEGTETILLVEDQAEVGKLAATALRRYGYQVLIAPNGNEAIAASKNYTGSIDLLLTDVVMPGMNGPAVAERVVALRPKIGVLFMSGYTESAISHRGVLDSGVAYLQKPFTPESLAEKVRAVLGSNTV
jgi:two-component system, cell cycle sensor histidine kinase and response regulator CckA